MTQPPVVLNQTDRRFRLLIGVAAFVIIAAGIRQAAELLNSILLAMVLIVTVVPVFESMRRRRVPKGVAVALTSLLLGAVVLALLGTLALSGTRLIQVLPQYQDRAESLLRGLESWMIARGVQPDQVLSLDLVNPGRLLGLAAGFLSGLGKVLSQVLLLLLIVGFFLAERGLHDRTFQPGGTAARVARDVRQYLVITSLTGLGFALLVYLLMLIVGTDLALVWAVLSFVMNFVPNIGIILALIPPVILTMLEQGWQGALVILAGFVVLNFVIDNLVKPRFMSSGLDVQPLLGLLSLVVWAYLLGPTGAVLALPLTIAIRRLLEEASLSIPLIGENSASPGT